MLRRRKIRHKLLDLQKALLNRRQDGDAPADLIAFTGLDGIYTPGELAYSHYISGDELRYWIILRSLFGGNDVNQLPDQSLIAEKMGKSRQSVNGYHKMLRATRWLSILDTIRVNNLPTRYIYALHEEQLDVEEAWYLDPNYISFILHEAQNGPERLLRYCRQTVAELDNNLLLRLSSEQLDIREQIVSAMGIRISLPLPRLSVVKNPDSGERSVVKNPDSGEGSVVKNPDSEESSVVKNPDSGEAPVVKNPDSGEGSVVKNPDSGENREDIYNTARVPADAVISHARAPTQSRIIPEGNNDNHPSFQDGGFGRKDGVSRFAFLQEKPYRLLSERLVAQYGKHNAHAVLNTIKRGRYTYKSDQFRHTVSADEAAIILVSLIDRDKDSPVQSPLDYTVSLIHRAHDGELCFVGKQYHRFLELSGQAEPEAQQQAGKAPTAVPPLPNGTRLVGRSGTEYQIVSGGLLTLDETIVPNKSDGLSCRIPDMEEIQALIAAGRLVIVGGGEA